MHKQGFVYMMSNRNRTVLYTGVTSDLERRLYQHKNRLIDGFTKKYNCTDLVWWEVSESIRSAIQREKQIKGWSRRRKDELVAELNPGFRDLSVDWVG